jgi:hypothetical protein
MKRLKVIIFFVIIILCNFIQINAENPKNDLRAIIGIDITLGKSTILDVLKLMGPSTNVHLASQDERRIDYSLLKYPENDFIVLEYQKEITLQKKHNCIISFYAESFTYIVTEVSITNITFFSDITVGEVKALYGKPARIIHQPFIVIDEVEGIPADCDDANGELESFLYPEIGLQVILDDKLLDNNGKEMQLRFVKKIRYSFKILNGQKTFPKCK